MPVSLVGFVAACILTSAILANLIFIRTTGTALGLAGLLLVYQVAPTHTPAMAGLLVFQDVLLLTATGLLIAADISTLKEKPFHEA